MQREREQSEGEGSRKPKPFITIHRKAMHRVREIGKEEEGRIDSLCDVFEKSCMASKRVQEAGNRSWGYTESEERKANMLFLYMFLSGSGEYGKIR